MTKWTDKDLDELLADTGSPPTSLSYEDFTAAQRYMAMCGVRKPYCLFAADMGLGKTGATLYAMTRLLNETEVKRWIVVAPLAVALNTWPDETKKWTFARHFKAAVAVGTEQERRQAVNSDHEVLILNRENVQWFWKYVGVVGMREYDGLVYDEASRLKAGEKKTTPTQRKDGSMSSPRLSEFGTICRMRRFCDHVIELSGTIAPKGLVDLWGPMYVLDKGKRLKASKTAFHEKYFSYNPYTRVRTPHAFAFDEITSLTSDVIVTLREGDYLELPPVLTVDRWVSLSKKTMETYRRLEKETILEEHDIEAVNSGVLTNKLLQLSNGSIYNSDKAAVPFHDEKIKQLESIYEEAAGEPMIVAYSFQFDLDRILKRFKKARLFSGSKKDMDDWNAGRIPMLLLHPASAGHGLNFQYGGSILVWYGLNWSLELWLQTRKRLPRRGQKAKYVREYRILTKGTFDERQLAVLARRDVDQTAITEVTRKRVADVERELEAAA